MSHNPNVALSITAPVRCARSLYVACISSSDMDGKRRPRAFLSHPIKSGTIGTRAKMAAGETFSKVGSAAATAQRCPCTRWGWWEKKEHRKKKGSERASEEPLPVENLIIV